MSQVNGIVGAASALKTVFASRYTVPPFQREYRWEAQHFSELVRDIQGAFLEQYDPSHGRQKVSTYEPYFVGSIITADDGAGRKLIVDGQQRLISLLVLFAYLHRHATKQSVAGVENLAPYIKRSSYGSIDYAIETSSARTSLFDKYLDLSLDEPTAHAHIDALTDLDDGDRRIAAALKTLPQLLVSDVLKALAHFVDYLIEKVTLIDIAVPNENDAHRVFVTMNDRGLRLGPIDLLKGYVLSKIEDSQANRSSHEAWMTLTNGLRALDPEEDSLFFRTMLRARWAETARDKKKKGEAPGDFEIIGDSYHRWFADNALRLGYSSADHYRDFATKEITVYGQAYLWLRHAEEKFNLDAPWVFYNALRKFTLQPMVLLSAVQPGDAEAVWKQKIALMARFCDLILTSRMIEGKDNKYDSIRDVAFGFSKAVRSMSYTDLLAWVRKEWPSHEPSIAQVADLSYGNESSDLLYVLSRIGDFLESEMSLVTRVGFETFVSRSRGAKTFDIEHVFPKTSTNTAALGFSDNAEFLSMRNRIGALLLLPRGRNRSLQDADYDAKLKAYATENVLAQTLCSGFYLNNPQIQSTVQRFPNLKQLAAFDRQAINIRGELYAQVAKALWARP